MADLTAIRQGLAAALEPLGFQVSPWVLSEPTPPCAYVTVGPEDYAQVMAGGHTELTFVVFVLVGMASEVGAQQQLDQMLDTEGAQSVKALLEADQTLDGAAFSVHVPSRTGERLYRRTVSTPLLGAEWTVLVRA